MVYVLTKFREKVSKNIIYYLYIWFKTSRTSCSLRAVYPTPNSTSTYFYGTSDFPKGSSRIIVLVLGLVLIFLL